MNINNLQLMEQLYPSSMLRNPNKVSQPEISSLLDNSIGTEEADSFQGILNRSLTFLDEKQSASDYAIQGLVTGEADDLHNVMIKTTEAQLSLELAVQLRNKCLDAMNEVKNMQF